MDSNTIKEKIKLAKISVENELEPFKIEAFKIVLSKLLDSELYDEIEVNAYEPKTYSEPLLEQKKEFAKKCDISIDELNDTISINNETIEIIAPLPDVSDAQKHLIVAQCALITYEIILDYEWTPASKLIECLKSLGVKDLANFALTLNRHPELIRSQGVKRSKKYRLTSGQGRISAFQTIHDLVKRDFNDRR